MELRLGKRPAVHDPKGRTLKLASILKELPPIPPKWDYDDSCKIPTPMFLNDQYGDCVMAGRGHQTLRFENTEQCRIIPISDNEIKTEYFKETGGEDQGLVVLDSLKLWKNEGWIAAGQKLTIDAFARIDPKNHQEVRAAIYLLTGVGIGVELPRSAQDQFEQGVPWTVPGFWNWSGKRILGGHYIYLCGYNDQGVIAVTWGAKTLITWPFIDKYADEMFAMVDNRNKPDSPIDVQKLESYLNEVSK